MDLNLCILPTLERHSQWCAQIIFHYNTLILARIALALKIQVVSSHE